VLDLTYFNPTPKQEAAAERLGMSFSTYRRQLATAVGRLTDWLWQQEQHGRETAPAAGQTPVPAAVTAEDGLPAARPRLSLVILPFLNLLGEASAEYLVDGLVDTLITDLSSWLPGSFVISRSTAPRLFTQTATRADRAHLSGAVDLSGAHSPPTADCDPPLFCNARVIPTDRTTTATGRLVPNSQQLGVSISAARLAPKNDTQRWRPDGVSPRNAGLLCGVPDTGSLSPIRCNAKTASQAECWRYRDDETMDYPLRSCDRADHGPVGLHQSVRSCPADDWRRSDRRRQWGCNRGCRCRRSRCRPRRSGRRSRGGDRGPCHNATTACLSRLLQSPALRLLQSSTLCELQSSPLRELQRAKPLLC